MGYIRILAETVKLISCASNWFLGYDVNHALAYLSWQINPDFPYRLTQNSRFFELPYCCVSALAKIPTRSPFRSFLVVGMVFSSRWPGAVIALTCFLYLCNDVKAQNETEKLPNFGDTVQILGAVSHLSI